MLTSRSSVLAAACLAGFWGGAVSSQLSQALHAYAQAPTGGTPQEVLRARRFELVDGNGKVLAKIAIAPAGNPYFTLLEDDKALATLGVVAGMSHLFLSSSSGRAGISLFGGSDPVIALNGDDGDRRLALSVSRNLPTLDFLEAGPKLRLTIGLRSSRPEALFFDSDGRHRLLLGLSPTQAGGLWLYDRMRFRGMFSTSESGVPTLDLESDTGIPQTFLMPGSVTLSDESGKPRTVASPGSITLSDEKGQSRAAIGRAQLETARTGELNTRSESSLVLFDREGRVLWAVP